MPAVLRQPADDVRLAAADALSLDPEVAYYTRYLSLYNRHPDERPDWLPLSDFALNSLSLQDILYFVQVVPGSDGSLLRVNLDDLGLDPAAWDDLGAKGSGPVRSIKKIDLPDPYFHLVVQVPTTRKKTVKKEVQARDAQGKTYTKVVEEQQDVVETVAQLQHGAWLDGADAAALSEATHTNFPIFRADWFLCNALITPAYSNFFGFKKLEDVQYAGRFRERDEDISKRGVVTISQNVALHQRAARYTPTSLGSWWETFDYLTSINDDDLLANLLQRRRDAGEIIFNLPNTLQGYALVNSSDKNEVIDVALTAVAVDKRTTWQDPGVWTAVSCITCHDKGIRDVTDEVRLLSNDQVGLLVKDRKLFRQVQRLYSLPIEEPVARGQATYARAINLVTRGWTPQALARRVEREFVRYVQGPLDLEAVAYEVGYRPEAIAGLLARVRGPDHTLSQLQQRRPVRRDQWESKGFAQMIIACRADAAARAAAQGGGGGQ